MDKNLPKIYLYLSSRSFTYIKSHYLNFDYILEFNQTEISNFSEKSLIKLILIITKITV